MKIYNRSRRVTNILSMQNSTIWMQFQILLSLKNWTSHLTRQPALRRCRSSRTHTILWSASFPVVWLGAVGFPSPASASLGMQECKNGREKKPKGRGNCTLSGHQMLVHFRFEPGHERLGMVLFYPSHWILFDIGEKEMFETEIINVFSSETEITYMGVFFIPAQIVNRKPSLEDFLALALLRTQLWGFFPHKFNGKIFWRSQVWFVFAQIADGWIFLSNFCWDALLSQHWTQGRTLSPVDKFRT